MPIYEYRCSGCGRRLSLYFQTYSGAAQPACSYCGSTNLARLVSSFAVVRSEESRMERLEDLSSFGDLDEADPGSLARFARRMEQELGEDLGPEYNEMVERMEAGEFPEESVGETAADLGEE